MGRLRDFLMGTPLPAPPERSGPYVSQLEAEAEAKRLTQLYVDHLNAFEGLLDAVEEEDGWYVLEHRGRKRPAWDAPSIGVGP